MEKYKPCQNIHWPFCVDVLQVGKDVGRWKPAIFIDAAMHAREWIAPSTAVYIIDYVRKALIVTIPY